MTIVDRFDLAADAIDWADLLETMSTSESFSAMLGPLYASGVLVTDYVKRIHPAQFGEESLDEALESADLETLRAWLTWIVRDDRFSSGGGVAFWHGDLDAVFDAIGLAVGHPYPLPPAEYILPRRIPPCPNCSDTEHVQYNIVGMPPAPPPGFDEGRVIFAGCLVDETTPNGDWWCSTCDTFYSHPTVSHWRFANEDEDAGTEAAIETSERLTVEELGQLYRDIVLDVPTKVVLDTDTKRQEFLRARQDVADIHARGYMVEIPD